VSAAGSTPASRPSPRPSAAPHSTVAAQPSTAEPPNGPDDISHGYESAPLVASAHAPVDYRQLWKALRQRIDEIYGEAITKCATDKDPQNIFRSQGMAAGCGAIMAAMDDLLSAARGEPERDE
jgi:hypothetical protein